MSKGLKEKILELFKLGKSYNEISQELHCAKATISFHCSKLKKLENKFTQEYIKIYQEFYDNNTSLTKTAKHFNVSRQTLSKYLNVRFKEKFKDREIVSHKNYRHKIKQQCVDYKGGKCQICGYNKNKKALEFHHINPKEKDHTLSGGTKSFEKLKPEIDKCILVCANCHREIHDGFYTDIYPLADTK